MQTINLLNDFKKPEKVSFNVKDMLRLLLLLMIVLLVIQVIGMIKKHKVEKQYHYYKSLNKEQLEKLTVLSAKIQNGDSEDKIGTIRNDIVKKSELISLIRYKRNSFSDEMQAISNSIIPGVWLNDFSIDQVHNQIKLSGMASNAKLVPIFMGNLKKEKALSHFKFKQFHVEKKETDGKDIHFIIDNNVSDNDDTLSVYSDKTKTDKLIQ